LRIRTSIIFRRPDDAHSANQPIDERELLAAAKDLFAKLVPRAWRPASPGVSVHNLETDKRQHHSFDTKRNRRWYLNRGLDSVAAATLERRLHGKGLELREHYATSPNGLVLSTPALSDDLSENPLLIILPKQI